MAIEALSAGRQALASLQHLDQVAAQAFDVARREDHRPAQFHEVGDHPRKRGVTSFSCQGPPSFLLSSRHMAADGVDAVRAGSPERRNGKRWG